MRMDKVVFGFCFGICVGGLVWPSEGFSAFMRRGQHYPTVAELEAQLPLRPGQPLAKEVQNPRTGQIFAVVYLHGTELGGGEYDARLKLVGQ